MTPSPMDPILFIAAPLSDLRGPAYGRLRAIAGPLRQAARARCAEAETILRGWAGGHGCSVLPRQGGWTAVLRLPPGVEEERLLTAAIDEGAWAHPGYFYGMPAGFSCVVLSLLTSAESLRNGLESVGKALQRT